MERRFDGRFQPWAAKWLEHVPKGTGGHRTLHCSVIGVGGEKDHRHMEVAADGDCGNDAIDSSSKSDVPRELASPTRMALAFAAKSRCRALLASANSEVIAASQLIAAERNRESEV
jgi:hypothetical protein